jgi:predicted Mrr-cat superfamily restriction endonuclease
LLMKLWTENYDKLDDEAHRLLSLKRIYFLAPQS